MYPTRNPDYPAALSQIQNCSVEELKEYLNDDSKLETLIKSLDQIKELYNEKEMLMISNKSLAEYNLSQEPILKDKKSSLRCKQSQVLELANKVKEIKSELESKSGHVQPDTMLALLQAANAEAEEESEKLAQDFLDGKMTQDLDEFLQQFQEQRKIAHSRRIKIDKMKELLLANPSSSSSRVLSPRRAAPPPPTSQSSNNWGNPTNLPYPPQPGMMLPPIPAYPPIPK